MKKLLSPKLLIPVVAVVLALGLVGYTLFAPDTMWKPLYVRFENAEAAPAEGTVTPAPPHAEPAEVHPVGIVIPYRPGSGIMYDLGTKIVNLAEPGGRRYLQVGVVLECLPSEPGFYDLAGEAKAKAEEEELVELEGLRPAMEDAVIGLLTSRTYAEIFTIEGKDLLKQEMLSQINGILGHEKVAAIYFTEFLVQ